MATSRNIWRAPIAARALHAGAQQVAGHTAPAVGGRHADREQLALVAHHPAEREADAAHGVEARRGRPRTGGRSGRSRRAWPADARGRSGSRPPRSSPCAAATSRPRSNGPTVRMLTALRLRVGPPCQRPRRHQRCSSAQRARPAVADRRAGAPCPAAPATARESRRRRSSGKISGIGLRLNHAVARAGHNRAPRMAASTASRHGACQARGHVRAGSRPPAAPSGSRLGREALRVHLVPTGIRDHLDRQLGRRPRPPAPSRHSLEGADAERRTAPAPEPARGPPRCRRAGR